MTEKPKCPFCGSELIPQNDIENTEPIRAKCINPHCAWFMWSFPWEIWQALIDGKKAQDALKEATKCINWTIDTIVKGLDREADIAGCCELTLEKIDDITSITKQDKRS